MTSGLPRGRAPHGPPGAEPGEGGPSAPSRAAEARVERVLRAVECIPRGRVASYGLIASLVGTGPRQVGSIMRLDGGGVPWWRVTNARGHFPPALFAKAMTHWEAEEIRPAPGQPGCHYPTYEVDREAFARAVERAIAEVW